MTSYAAAAAAAASPTHSYYCTAVPAKSQSQYPPKLARKDVRDYTSKTGLDCAMWDKKASVKLTVPPPSFADKIHFPFIILYHKHESTGGGAGLRSG